MAQHLPDDIVRSYALEGMNLVYLALLGPVLDGESTSTSHVLHHGDGQCGLGLLALSRSTAHKGIVNESEMERVKQSPCIALHRKARQSRHVAEVE